MTKEWKPAFSALARFRPYPEYKDSGIEWLGQMPMHWRVTKMWDVALATSGGTPAKETLRYWDGGIPWVSPKDMKRRFIDSSEDTVSTAAISESGLKLITDPAVLVVVRGMILAHSFPVGITKVPVTINQDMKALRLRKDVDPEFFGYWLEGVAGDLLAVLVDEAAHGTKAIRMDTWRVTPVEIPPEDEQRAIVDFLDRETAKIDALVTKKERVIELLQEKRTALITQAVTKGLDPNVPMKDSGVDWLGEIPAHWSVERIRHVVRGIEQGWSPECENRQADEDEWGVLKAGCVNRGLFIESEHKALPLNLPPIPDLEIAAGDLLMSRASGSRELVGSVALVPTCRPRLLLCDKLFRLHVSAEHADRRFLALAMNSRVARWQVEIALSGGSGLANNIAQQVVKDLIVALPARNEQEAIAAFLDEEIARLDALMAKVLNAIECLRELRTALISCAATGKIDVREDLNSEVIRA